jgi:serine/threonine-protein kinase
VTATDVAGVREGELLAGKYRVDRILGVGGMGVVVAAHHVDLDERVAIKFLLPDVLTDGQAVARFAREARAAVKIKSEHVAKVTDVGKLENGAPYMVMEYLDGIDLSAWLEQRGALPIEQAVEFVLQACEAIAEAHALGIVHRDLKPGNLFVTRLPDGMLSVKVLDFGISKMTGLAGSGSGPAMTKTSALMGSPLYMSPEQMQSSRDVDARSDIWALGVILYELTSGTQPFTADTMPELVLKVVQGAAPRSIGKQRSEVPPGLEQVILRCLERDRARRFQGIGELAAALVTYGPRRAKVSVERISGVLRSAGLSASALVPPPSSDHEARAQSAHTEASWGKTASPKARAPWIALSAVGVALTLAAIGWRVRHGNEAPAASAHAEGDVAPKAPVAVTQADSAGVVATSKGLSAPNGVAPVASSAPSSSVGALGDASALPAASSGAHTKTGRPRGAAKPAVGEVAPPPARPVEPLPAPARPAPADDKQNIFEDRK